MSAKHNPGPWTADIERKRDPQLGEYISRIDIMRAHQRIGAVTVHSGQVGLQPEANAHLIAAAPELLEALKTTVGNIRSLHGAASGDVYETYSVWLEVVEAAIAKAEGRTEEHHEATLPPHSESVPNYPTLRHPFCKDENCHTCLHDHNALGRFLSEQIGMHEAFVLGELHGFMSERIGNAQTEYGWAHPDSFKPENINAFLKTKGASKE